MGDRKKPPLPMSRAMSDVGKAFKKAKVLTNDTTPAKGKQISGRKLTGKRPKPAPLPECVAGAEEDRPLPWEPEAVKKLIEDVERFRTQSSGDDIQVIALRKFSEVAEMWSLTDEEAASLLNMPTSEWRQAKKDHSLPLTNEQLCRLSALFGIHKALEMYLSQPLSRTWIKLENSGPDFKGQRPVDELIHGGLPSMIRERRNLTALCAGN